MFQVYRVLFAGDSSTVSDLWRRQRRSSSLDSQLKDALSAASSADNLRLPDIVGVISEQMHSTNDLNKLTSVLTGQAVDGKTLTNIIHVLAPELKFLPDKGFLFQMLADNPQLLLDPEFRRLLTGVAEAASRHEMEKYLAGLDPTELIGLVKVKPQITHS